jgi:hypothetical protein
LKTHSPNCILHHEMSVRLKKFNSNGCCIPLPFAHIGRAIVDAPVGRGREVLASSGIKLPLTAKSPSPAPCTCSPASRPPSPSSSSTQVLRCPRAPSCQAVSSPISRQLAPFSSSSAPPHRSSVPSSCAGRWSPRSPRRPPSRFSASLSSTRPAAASSPRPIAASSAVRAASSLPPLGTHPHRSIPPRPPPHLSASYLLPPAWGKMAWWRSGGRRRQRLWWRIPRPPELLLSMGGGHSFFGGHSHRRGCGFSGNDEVLELRPLARGAGGWEWWPVEQANGET